MQLMFFVINHPFESQQKMCSSLCPKVIPLIHSACVASLQWVVHHCANTHNDDARHGYMKQDNGYHKRKTANSWGSCDEVR